MIDINPMAAIAGLAARDICDAIAEAGVDELVRAKVRELIVAHNTLRADHDGLVDAYNGLVEAHDTLSARFEQSLESLQQVMDLMQRYGAAMEELMPGVGHMVEANERLLHHVAALQIVVDRNVGLDESVGDDIVRAAYEHTRECAVIAYEHYSRGDPD